LLFRKPKNKHRFKKLPAAQQPIQSVTPKPEPKKSQPIQAVKSKDTTPPRIVLHQRGPEQDLVSDTVDYTIEGQAIDESGISKITVNDKSIRFDKSGNFTFNAQLSVGKNPIRITATDTHDNTAYKNITIVRKEDDAVKFAGNRPESDKLNITGDYRALIIGINDYKDKSHDDLITPVNDAHAIAKILKNQYGFTVTTLLNEKATRRGILRALQYLTENANKDDHLLIYYAGHGFHNEEKGEAYWLPSDADSFDDTWITASKITTQIKASDAKHILIVADSCYSGTLAKDRSAHPDSNLTRLKYLEKMLRKPSRILMSSGGDEPVSDIGGQGHSIFARVFLDGLRDIEKSTFTAQELFIEGGIKEGVSGKVDQTPEFHYIKESGHGYGDFVFQRK